jgi:DNA-binding transcriptional ArsR family regulator
MNATSPARVITWLRASGEPSRLRLLSLCAEAALAVSDLAQVLRQSEPRVSRHLKILCQAGLVTRVREGQWVRYGLADDPSARSFIRGLLAHVDRRDPQLTRDRNAARSAATPEPHTMLPGSPSRLARALGAFVEAGGSEALQGRVIAIGAAHPELLANAAVTARDCTVIAHSRRSAQAVRAFAEQRGFSCRVLTSGGSAALSDATLVQAGGPFDAALLHHHPGGDSVRLIEQARGLLAPHGRLWIFQTYESLERAGERVVEHPLARLRRLLTEAGLACERLSPIEADGEHVLAAAARPASGAAHDAHSAGQGGA